MTALWERQPEETAKAFHAFTIYRDLGANRSLEKTAQAIGHKNLSTVEGWSSRYEWVARAAAYDAWIDQTALTLRAVDLPTARQWVSDDLALKLAGLDAVISEKLARLKEAAEQGKEVSALDIQRLANVIEISDTLKRRNVGLPTAFRTETAEAGSDDPEVYYVGG